MDPITLTRLDKNIFVNISQIRNKKKQLKSLRILTFIIQAVSGEKSGENP